MNEWTTAHAPRWLDCAARFADPLKQQLWREAADLCGDDAPTTAVRARRVYSDIERLLYLARGAADGCTRAGLDDPAWFHAGAVHACESALLALREQFGDCLGAAADREGLHARAAPWDGKRLGAVRLKITRNGVPYGGEPTALRLDDDKRPIAQPDCEPASVAVDLNDAAGAHSA